MKMIMNNVDIENSYRNSKLLLEPKSCQPNMKIDTIFMTDTPINVRALLRYEMLGMFASLQLLSLSFDS